MTETSERTLRAWAAMRVLYEQHRAGPGVIADAARLAVDSVAARAERERWTPPRTAGEVRTLSQRIGALAERLVGEIEAIERSGADAGYDKARIAARAPLRAPPGGSGLSVPPSRSRRSFPEIARTR